MISLPKQQGAAIIVALFVTALVAAMSIALMDRLRVDTRRTELLLNANQAYFYAQGSIAWAIDQLNNDWKTKQNGQLIDKTPMLIKDKQNNALIESSIEDAQANFNINNIADVSYQPDFERLIHIVSPQTDAAAAKQIVLSIMDWINPGIRGGLFNDYYSQQNPPYQSPHKPMVSISELRLIKGITPELYAKLAPFVTALPEITPININNAPAPVLMSLSKTLTLDAAKSLVLARQQTPFLTPQQFAAVEVIKSNPIPDNKITVTSQYFLVQSKVTIGQQQILLYTLVQRMAKEAQSHITILWQTKGTL